MSHNVFKIRSQAPVWQCDRMPSQTQRISGAPHSCYGAASHGHCYLFAPVRHDPVSRYARHLERSSPSRPVLAHCHASPVSRAENLGRTGPLDAGLDHRLALSPRAQGRLLGCPCAGGVVGRGSAADLATTQGRDTPSGGGWQCQTQAGDAESLGPKRAEKRASALVFRHPVCPVDCHVGRLSSPRGLSRHSAQNRSGVPDGKCVVS